MAKKSARSSTSRGWEQLSIVDEPDSVPRAKEAKEAEDAMESKRRKGRGPGTVADERRRGSTGGAGSGGEAPASQATAEGPPLEQALARLEAIVRELEAGNIDLDRALALFEEGVALSRQAAKRLTEAEAKITKLVRSLDGELRTEPFAIEGEDAET